MKLLTITLYKLKIMLSDRLFFAAMIILPLFISGATGSALRYEKLNIVPVAVTDEDGSSYSKLLLERLSKKEGLGLDITTREQAVQMVKNNKVEAAFIVRKGFEDKIRKGDDKEIIDIINAPLSFSFGYVSEVVAGEVMRFTANSIAAQRVLGQYDRLDIPVNAGLSEEVMKYADSQWEPKPLMTIDYREMEGGSAIEVSKVSVPTATTTSVGIIVMFIMLYILFSSGWLIDERTNGTLRRLVSGSNALRYSFMGNISTLVIAGIIQIAVISVVNRWVFQVELFPGGWSYAVLGAYLLAVISVSMFLSSVLKTPAQLQAGAPVLALLTGFVGGCFWNFTEVSEQIKQLARFTPQGWALEGINSLIINSENISAVYLPMGVLILMSLILLPVSYIIIKVQVRM
ncbi:MAG: ABC transporter permease [Clostridia bacterium]|nr:ABC transporter permease [Clostridia bacterium]